MATFRGENGEIPVGFEELKRLFTHGIAGQNLLERIAEDDFPTVFHYLNELTTVRRFWMEIYRLLKDGPF